MLRRVLLATAMSSLALACSGAQQPSVNAELRSWAAGPVRWLLQADERRQLDRIATRPQAVAFRQQFWARRDGRGRASGPGSFRELFEQRVEAADLLYAGDTGGQPGSLSDRGRALVILGAPPRLERRSWDVVAWSPGSAAGEQRRQRLPAEVWTYEAGDLLEGQAELAPIQLVFLLERSGARLRRGQRDLVQAAAALVRR